MDLRRIEIFCRIVELKSFTKAAEAVRLSQPTVSEHIRLLEEDLGEKLLERSGREIAATPAGRLFYKFARRLLNTRDEARQALAEFRGKLAGELLIGASTIPGAYLLPQLVQSFKQTHPEIRTRLKISSTASILDELQAGLLELALVGSSGHQNQLELTPIAADELILVTAADHPWAERAVIQPHQLIEQPFILREKGSGSRTTVETALQAQGVPLEDLQIVAEMGNSESLRQAVKAGLGLTILSKRAVAEELAAGTLCQLHIEGLQIHRNIYLARHLRRTLSPLAEAFRQHLLAQTTDQAATQSC